MPNGPRFSSLNRWLFIATVGAALPAAGQVRVNVPPPVGGDEPSSHDDKSTPPGVSVPDSPGASERLDKARDKENQKQWKTAAEYYQEALSKYPGRVVPVRRDPDQGIYQYAGTAPVVQERLAKWPQEGLKIYRQMYGPTAADLLAAAPRGDLAALRNIFWNYFVTDAGKTAALRLLDGYLEAGDFQAAAWMGDRLLTLHPSLGNDRSMLMYRTALAYYWAGDPVSSHRILADLKQSGAADIGMIAGKDVVLVDSLTQVLDSPPLQPTTRPSDADTYPSFGGMGGRGDISPSTARPGASLNQVVLTPPSSNGLMGGSRKQYADSDQNSLLSYAAMGIMPAVDAGALFFQDGRSIYAVDVDSGAPLPGWLNTYGGERAGRYKLNIFGRARNELLTTTVTPSAVLAIMGQPDRVPQVNGNFNGNFVLQNVQTSSTVRLVCLDRDTGRELWARAPVELPDSISVLHTAEYCGTPLVIPAAIAGRMPDANSAAEDSVLVVARGGKENQFDDCYVVCLSLKTGQYRWSTYIGSATRNFDLEGLTTSEPSQIALANGRVFIMTNLGTVAALDPSDGRVIWLNSYARDGADNPEAMLMRGRRWGGQMQNNSIVPTKPWAHNPVFVNGGYVYVLPNDCKQLFVYDEGSGAERKRLPMSQIYNADVMLGVRNGIICVTSDKGVFAFDWRKYDPQRPGKFMVWTEDDITGGGGGRGAQPDPEPSTVCGRGFVTADSVFIPTKFRLIQKSWKSGKTIQPYPAVGGFTGMQGPGNLLVTANNVVVAGQTQVDVYTNLDLVRQRFETAMSIAPNDPHPRMEYAEALFSGGQAKDALARVDEAINLVGGTDSMHSGQDRAMIFARALDFARRTVRGTDKETAPQTIATGNAFFDRAAAAADSPVEKAAYRIERARFDHQLDDYAAEVKLCQQILSDDAMRVAVLENDVPAATSAETAIDLACTLDHSIYHDIEQQAQDLLKTARSAGDPQQLLMVATVYPNSKAAIDARQEAVQRFEASNEPEKAIDVLRRIYASTVDPVDRANLLVSIANDFLSSASGVGPAIDRLCRAARIAQSPRISQKIRLPDGTTLSDITYTQVIASLRQLQADQETAALPDFHLAAPTRRTSTPFVPGQALVIGNVNAVVHPLHGFARNDQILTWSPDGLCVYPVGQTIPLATIAAIGKLPLGAAWVHGNWIIWTRAQVYQISGDAKLIWRFSIADLPTLVVSSGRETAVNDAGDSANDETAQAQGGGFVRVNGQLIQVPPGGVVNMQRLRRGGMPQIAPVLVAPVVTRGGDEEIVDVAPGGPSGAQLLVSTSVGRIVALDGRSGQILWQNRPVDHAVDQLLTNGHFTVARMDDPAGSQMTVFDTPTGRVIGRRIFGPDGSPRQLVNVALSEEATLAVTLGTQVLVKDLYDPWKASFTELAAQANRDTAPFTGLNQSDQLIIKAGRLACVYDSGGYARGYDLSRNADPTNPLTTGADSIVVSLRMVGPRLYVLTSNKMLQYNLDDATDHYEGERVTEFPPKVHGLCMGKDYAVVIDDPVDRGPLGSPMTVVVGYHRSLIPGKTRESGNAWPTQINSPVGITDWLCSEGAIYYLTRDNNLHVLRGARP